MDLKFENMKIRSTNNNNLVKCYEYFNNDDNFTIIMELCDQSLLQLLMEKIKKDQKCFNIEEILEIMKQLNNALKIMKENNRNLKLENILIKYNDEEKKKYTIKLTDYGCSKRLKSLSKNYGNTPNIGTIVYMAPEILKGEEYNYKVDLWSIGIIIYRLYFGKSPFFGENEEALIKNIDKFGTTLIKKTENKELDDLIIKLLEINKSKRLNWDEYLNHSFFKEDKNIIILIYEKESYYNNNIFGEKFVENNKNNIELIINGIKSELVKEYELRGGENKIEIKIKNKITNLEYMFYKCNSLKNIEELKYLDTKEINNFSYMFSHCYSLSDIKGLEKWNVSNGNNFSHMFSCCNISDIKGLEKWNVSNGNNFSNMFNHCYSLSDIKGLEKWNVSNGNNFSSMFDSCSNLSDIKGFMFSGCYKLLK